MTRADPPDHSFKRDTLSRPPAATSVSRTSSSPWDRKSGHNRSFLSEVTRTEAFSSCGGFVVL
jgi:hypothetical protein